MNANSRIADEEDPGLTTGGGPESAADCGPCGRSAGATAVIGAGGGITIGESAGDSGKTIFGRAGPASAPKVTGGAGLKLAGGGIGGAGIGFGGSIA